MVEEILGDYTILIEHILEAIDIAVENADFAAEDMLKGFMKKIHKHHWMFTDFISE